MRIAVVAPSCTLNPTIPGRIETLAEAHFGARAPELFFHPQCFLSDGHFAGPDAARVDALVAVANDPAFDAIWFARGGYGACRVAEAALDRFGSAARNKQWLGYSDAGFVLAGLDARGFERVTHGPMPADLNRDGGGAAVTRALDWLVDRDPATVEPSAGTAPRVAYNLTVLSNLLGTSLEPDFAGRELIVEDVSEHLYRIDRALFHVTGSPSIRRVAGLRLGRCSLIPDNDPDFGMDEEAIVRHWCEASGIAWLGRADIGHDVANKVVPFGRA